MYNAIGMPFKGRRTREKFLQWQVGLLEVVFKADRFPPADVREQLAIELGITERCVRVWFQNRRQRHRKAQGKDGPAEKPPATADGLESVEDTGSEHEDAPADEDGGGSSRPKAQPPALDPAPLPAGGAQGGGEPAPARDKAGAGLDEDEGAGCVGKMVPHMVIELAKQFRPLSHVLSACCQPYLLHGDGRGGPGGHGAHVLQPMRGGGCGMGEPIPMYPQYGLPHHDAYGGPMSGAAYAQAGGQPQQQPPPSLSGQLLQQQPQYIMSNGACYQLVGSAEGGLGHGQGGGMLGGGHGLGMVGLAGGYLLPAQMGPPMGPPMGPHGHPEQLQGMAYSPGPAYPHERADLYGGGLHVQQQQMQHHAGGPGGLHGGPHGGAQPSAPQQHPSHLASPQHPVHLSGQPPPQQQQQQQQQQPPGEQLRAGGCEGGELGGCHCCNGGGYTTNVMLYPPPPLQPYAPDEPRREA